MQTSNDAHANEQLDDGRSESYWLHQNNNHQRHGHDDKQQQYNNEIIQSVCRPASPISHNASRVFVSAPAGVLLILL